MYISRLLVYNNGMNTETTNPIPKSIDILKESIEFYKEHFKKVIILSGIHAVPAFLAYFVFSDNVLASTLLLIATGVLQLLGYVALLVYIKDPTKYTNIAEAFKDARFKILPLIWVSLLSGLILMLAAMLLIVPAIIAGIWFSFIAFIVIEENVGGLKALIKSKMYVQGNWWNVFRKLVFMVLVSVVFGAIFGVAISIFGVNITEDKELFELLTNYILNPLLTPIMVIFNYKLFKYIKIKKGNFDVTSTRNMKVLLIAAAVIGALALLGLIVTASMAIAKNPNDYLAMTRNSKKIADISAIRKSIEQYRADSGDYPNYLKDLEPKYTSSVSKNPDTGQDYEYIRTSSGYEICAELDAKEKTCLTQDVAFVE